LFRKRSLSGFLARQRAECEASPWVSGLWVSLFERRRLKLPALAPDWLGPARTTAVLIPGIKEEGHSWDTPLEDLALVLQLAKSREARRILEVGTYRAKTTYALALNRPDAQIVSYDIAVADSWYRQELGRNPRVQLRVGDFAQQGGALRNEPPFDFIFIDGGHTMAQVLADSAIAWEIIAREGIIIWHDYRKNGFYNPGLRVPEALHRLAQGRRIQRVPGTACALYSHEV